jgi:alkylhydroperoxidase family enzyme
MISVESISQSAPYVKIPNRGFVLRFLIWTVEKVMGKKLLPARVLLWYPKTLISSGILEALAAHNEKSLGQRLLKLVRMQASFSVSCPFCIDMNSFKHDRFKITEEEVHAIQGQIPLQDVPSFSERERIALEYARSASGAPLRFSSGLIAKLKKNFTDREIVILASTIAQVNYWGRLIQALGIPPAGFSNDCPYLNVEKYTTLVE